MSMPSCSSLYARMMRAPVELGRLVHFEQRRSATLLAPEVEHEGAHLLGVVGELEFGDVLRHGPQTSDRTYRIARP